MTQALLLALLAALGGSSTALPLSRVQIRRSQLTPVLFAQQNNDERQVFTQKQRLREETEAPFRTARFFLYGGVGAAASVGAFFSVTQALAAYVGARPADLLPEYLQNLGVNAAGVGAAVVAWYFDSRAQQQRLARLAKGQRLSALKVQVAVDGRGMVLALADLRRGRSAIDRRVVIYAAGNEAIEKAVSAATENGDLLKSTDLLFVPIVIEPETEVADEKTVLKSLQVKDPDVEGAAEAAASGYVGLPYLLNEWKALLSDEVKNAIDQEVNLEEGICIILKKNGRVGSRSTGIPNWNALSGDVLQRETFGLDTKNI